MKLATLNKILNFFLLALVIEFEEEEGRAVRTRLYMSTIFKVGTVKIWPHIRLLDQLGF